MGGSRGPPYHRHFLALESDIASDPPGIEPKIGYTTTSRGARRCATSSRADAGAPAGWRGLGGGAGGHLHPQRHAHGCALALRLDHRRRQARLTIDETPLDWCFQPGVKLDFRASRDGYVATADDVEAELERIGQTCSRSTSCWSTQRPASVRQARIHAYRLRHGPRGDAVPDRARRARHRHRRLVLGRAVQPHGQEVGGDARTRR